MSGKQFDVLVVGAGLYGCTIAHEAVSRGKRVCVLEKREHIGGNCYTEEIAGINVHRYGAHIFRTNDDELWQYMGQFCRFNNFVNSPIANYRGTLYNLPFNMNTFNTLWGVVTPDEAIAKIDEQRIACEHPTNLEEHVLDLVGVDIFEKLVKGYTEKQWGKDCRELPPSIMRRIPLRFTYDNNYFNDFYQGIPMGGYTKIFEQMLEGSEVLLGTDFLAQRDAWLSKADRVVYTGPIDAFFEFSGGVLGYRSLRFEHDVLDQSNYQGVAVMNYTDRETPYTRVIEHKHFEKVVSQRTVVTHEYPAPWSPGDDPYYPMEDEENRGRYQQYRKLASAYPKVLFGGRLGEYRYYDMQDTLRSALKMARRLFGEEGLGHGQEPLHR